MAMALELELELERLRCADVLLIAGVVLLLDLLMRLWSRRGSQLSPEEQALLRAYNEQVRVVTKLSSVDMFVEQAKATRKMNTIKKQMQELAVARMAASAPTELQKQVDRARTPLLLGAVMLYYWNEPLVVLPQGFMLPLERLMAFPGFPLGAISAVGWAGICRRVSAKVLG